MTNRSLASNLGLYVYALGAIALGLIGLAWGDFATMWQRVLPSVPFREPLAYLTAIVEFATGIAILWRRTARIGAVALTALYSIFTLLWVPKIFALPLSYDPAGNFFEELSLVIGGAVAYLLVSPPNSGWAKREPLVARLYVVCVLSFGIVHIIDLPGLPSWIPAWIPPGPKFWAYATTVCFFLAAASILTGILSALATRLLTAMILGFTIFVWGLKLLSTPHDHFSWSGFGISLAMSGAAWAVSDSISACARQKPTVAAPVEPLRSIA
ncbi:MAG TPA: hypothetical protein VKR52_16255 [Terracidiphilus sp.]|nr:hypothetical protein [Terracidiphilus sp.]